MIHFPVTLVLTSWRRRRTFLRTATGCAYLSTFSTSCAYWSTSAYMGLRRATCRTPSARSRVRNHGVACASRRRPTSSCRRCDVQQWATAPSPSQDRALGTVCPMRSVAAQPPLNVFLKPTFMSSVLLTLFLLSLVRASLTL